MASSKGLEWMGIHHHEQDIGLPSTVSGIFLIAQGVTPRYFYLHSCIKYKREFSVYSKPCVVYTVMRLIPWKQSHGSETIQDTSCKLRSEV